MVFCLSSLLPSMPGHATRSSPALGHWWLSPLLLSHAWLVHAAILGKKRKEIRVNRKLCKGSSAVPKGSCSENPES